MRVMGKAGMRLRLNPMVIPSLSRDQTRLRISNKLEI